MTRGGGRDVEAAMIRARAFLLAALLAVLTVPVAFAQRGGDERLGGVGITVFSEINFTGTNATFRDDVPDLRKYNLNDRINSLRVARGEMWEGCENINYKGLCQVFSGEEDDLRQVRWNGKISSLRRIRDGGRGGRGPFAPSVQERIQLYERTNYRGNSRTVTNASASLGSFGDNVQSVRILAGEWEICERPRYGGRCQTIRGSVPDVRRLGFDGVASVRPR
jgi:hypothetical protein